MEKRVIIYARVSTDEQAEKGYSIPAQIERVQTFCKIKGWKVIAVFTEDYTAKNGFNRPEYNKLVEFVKADRSQLDYILLTQWSRFSRDVTASYNELRRLQKLSIEANAIEQWIDFNVPEAKYLLSLYLTAPQVENERLSLRVKAALIQGRSEGKYMAKAPFGYYNDRLSKLILPDPVNSKLVKFCFEKFRERIYSAEEVRRLGKEKGVNLGKQAFLNMLKNKAYIGKVEVPNYDKKPPVWINGLHEAIIDNDLFDEVQYILSGKKKPYNGNSKLDEVPLRHQIICPGCGRLLTGSGSTSQNGKIHHYYHCQGKKYNCYYRASAKKLNAEFINFLQKFEPKPNVLSLYQKILEEEFNVNVETREGDKKRLQLQIEETTRRSEALLRRLLDEVISPETYKSMSKKFENELMELKSQYNTLLQIPSEYFKYLKFGVSIIGNISSFYKDADLLIKRKLVSSIFPENLIFENGNYRTTKTNAFLELFTLNINDFGIKKGGKFAALSTSAPETGL